MSEKQEEKDQAIDSGNETKESPYLEDDVLTSQKKPFETKGACVIAITRAKLQKTHEPIRVPNGYIGRRAIEQEKKVIPPLKCDILCRVTRTNVAPENANVPITVKVNDRKNRRVFLPGQEIALSQAHIDVLRQAVAEVSLPISPDSGIYESANPVQLAKNMYPSMIPTVNPQTGEIVMIQRTPNYVVEILGPASELDTRGPVPKQTTA